jgi:hypothetical protein
VHVAHLYKTRDCTVSTPHGHNPEGATVALPCRHRQAAGAAKIGIEWQGQAPPALTLATTNRTNKKATR